MDIKKLIYKKLNGITKQKFDDNSDITKIGIDSLDLVELVTEAEDELNVEIADEELETIKTVDDVVKLFTKATKGKK